MGAQPAALGREDLAGGLPMWTLIGAGATRLFIVEAKQADPDHGERLVGTWPLNQMGLDEESLDRKVGPVQVGVYRAVRFTSPVGLPGCCNRSAVRSTICSPHTGRRSQTPDAPDSGGQTWMIAGPVTSL
ncbi:MAG: hypothetical protein QOH82_2014 [Mycobacterium sp.]|nr:hypothetical protein [Mycobacterium sp.]